jgi:hypothetical protein
LTPEETFDKLTSAEVAEWLHDSRIQDIQKFLLNPPKELADIKSAIAEQISAKNKARKKLPSWYNLKEILWPPPLSIEQASSETTSRFKKGLISGQKLTDLTGGTGVDVLALADNFEHIEYVEQDQWLKRVFDHNKNVLGYDRIKTVHLSAENYMDRLTKGQCVYLDPARRDDNQDKVFLLEACSPNILDILPKLREKNCKALIKLSPLLDIHLIIQELHPIKLTVLAVNNECKELLAFINPKYFSETLIHAINLIGNTEERFEFHPSEEKHAQLEFGDAENYLYEANAAIMKSGAFGLAGEKYKLKKIAPNTHLYTSSELKHQFPGRVFRILEKNISAKKLKTNALDRKLNVITRNYPMNASQITTKYGLLESGNKYLIAYTNAKGERIMQLTEWIKTSRT